MQAVSHRALPGFGLSLGYTVFYLSALVLLPLGACFLKAASLTPAQFLDAVWTERARAAYALTFGGMGGENVYVLADRVVASW